MKLVDLSTRQPISVIVGVLFTLMAGMIAFQVVAIEMAPEVEDTIIAINTRWENASPQEVESEIIDSQEDKLQGLTNLVNITSTSSLGEGSIRLEFSHGVDKDIALREVSDKLREVPSYPFGVDEPVVQATDPDSRDYIAWFILWTQDLNYDVRTFYDFAEDNIKPSLESIEGMSEVNILGGTEKEVQIIVDPQRLAHHGIPMTRLVGALREGNSNASGGAISLGKLDVRLRAVGRFSSPEAVQRIVIGVGEEGVVTVGDVATVNEGFKEAASFVRTKGKRALAFNFQREPGSNVLDIMERLKSKVEELNLPGGVLDLQTQKLGLKEPLIMELAYDATRYVRQALNNVNNNVYIGGALAIIVLLLFLRSLRSVGIIALSIPVSMVGAIVLMVILGRTVNVISLAGIAFAVGMVVDNSIVVLENIYRHLEMGKKRFEAAYDGTVEVAGAVLASSLTTLIVFVPILLISDQAGQLFRDIALSIMTSVAFSYVVAVTVIPSIASRTLNEKRYQGDSNQVDIDPSQPSEGIYEAFLLSLFKSTSLRIILVALLSVFSIAGSAFLMPDLDYLPEGNRNVTFGPMLVPPGLNLEQLEKMGHRVEEVIKPYWENDAPLQPVPVPMAGGMMVTPTPISNYFLVGAGGIMFHGCISSDDRRAIDNIPLLQHATRPDILPGTIAFAYQFPLFRIGGDTGSAVKIHLTGSDLGEITPAAGAMLGHLMENYGPWSTRPSPSNFNLKVQELQVRMKDKALAEAGLTRQDVFQALQVAGDGVFLGEYQMGGDLVDLKLWSNQRDEDSITRLDEFPLVSSLGKALPLSEVAEVIWTSAAEQIKRVDGRRAVSLEFTGPKGMPLETVVSNLQDAIENLRAVGAIPTSVETHLEGAAGKLTSIRKALLGDTDFKSFVSSSMFLSFTAVYLLMCILFQSWSRPLVIMFTVPLATFGGFLGLSMVHYWSSVDRYMPEQNLDVLTLLGFVILSGVVVNNAILIVAQTKQLLDRNPDLDHHKAIAMASQSRIRPIFMSLLTSVGGMLPLVLNPGAGSELYRGLGAVVVGGMLLSTLFTLILIPILMSLLEDFLSKIGNKSKLLAVGIILLSLTGCDSITKKTEVNLDKDVANELPGDYHKPLLPTNEGISLSPWWAGFQDPLLNELVGSFLQNHPSAELFEARLKEAEARLGRERLEYFPSTSISASIVKENNVLFGRQNDHLWSSQGDLRWQLDWTGRVRHAIRSQLAQLRAIEHDFMDWKVGAHISLIENHLTVRSLRQSLLLHDKMIVLAKKNLKMEESLFKAGRSDRSLVLRRKAELENLRQQGDNLTFAMDLARMEVESWSGLESGSLTKAYAEPFSLTNPAHQELGVPLQLLEQRADLRRAEEQVFIEAAALDIAKVEVLPYLEFTGSISWFAPRVGDLFESNSKGFQFGPGIRWRLLELPRVMRERAAQRSRLDQAVALYRQNVREAVLEVEKSLADFHVHDKLLRSHERTVNFRKDLAQRSLDLNRAGRIASREFLRDEMARLEAMMHLEKFQLELWIRELRVYQALGG